LKLEENVFLQNHPDIANKAWLLESDVRIESRFLDNFMPYYINCILAKFQNLWGVKQKMLERCLDCLNFLNFFGEREYLSRYPIKI